MRIAIDAMGGDRAPREVVAGTLEAAAKFSQHELILVGDEGRVRAEVKGPLPANVRLVHTAQVVGMDEHAVEAVRRKPDASVCRCVDLVKRGEAEAVVSAGHTGAAVAASTLSLGLLEGVKRPGIATPLPNEKGRCILIDVGANIHCKPLHLLQYGIMAAIYSQAIGGVARPRVGLLNIGEEEEKGTDLVRQTLALFHGAKLDFDFVGNVEGFDIFRGTCDVVVCEGFLGNVILKSSEGLAEALMRLMAAELGALAQQGKISSEWKTGMARLQRRTDYSEYGGAPLMGLNGVCIIGHGRSDAHAIFNAIRVAGEFGQQQVNARIVEAIRGVGV